MAEFFAMGGYGGYVWSAYPVSVVVLGYIGLRRAARLRDARKRAKLSKNDSKKPL
ncbi:MAG: heme exporter protein CcmD [Pseudomonadota bacterium]